MNEQSVRDGSSLLQEAISVKKWDIAMDLVQRGINVNIQDNHGNTALHYLCSKPECIVAVQGFMRGAVQSGCV